MKNHIPPQQEFVPSPIYEMAAQVASSHQVTAEEQLVLRKAFLEKPLNEEEHRIVNRIYRAFRRGRIKIV